MSKRPKKASAAVVPEVLATKAQDGDLTHQASSNEIIKYDPLERYISEIRSIPQLSAEEEHELAVKFKTLGDTQAGYKLVTANLRMVVNLAREYQRNIRNVLDLIQEGNMGLLEAVKKFDPFRGIRFPAYATFWVRAYILRYLINNLRLVKIGTTQAQRKLFFNLRKEKARLEAEGFKPEPKLIAHRLSVKESDVIEMEQRLLMPEMSIDAPVSTDPDAPTLHGILADNAESIEDQLARKQLQEAIRNALQELEGTLDPKEMAVVKRRLLADEPETLQVIADEFKLSRERIRQIEGQVKEKLKNYLAQKLGAEVTGIETIKSDEVE
ncbi:RNA polymerase factor sigma-32 [bacterium]|nr:RNA polymerase factor sigma-32 [bacterium]